MLHYHSGTSSTDYELTICGNPSWETLVKLLSYLYFVPSNIENEFQIQEDRILDANGRARIR